MTKPKNPYIYIEVDINNDQEVIDLFKNNTSGTFAKPNYLQKQYPELYNNIIEWSERFNLELIFSQKIYHYIHKMKTQPLCRTCNKVVPNFMSVNIGYKDYCSNSCAKLHPDTKNKLKDTLLNKYGTADLLNSTETKERIKQNNLNNLGCEHHTQSKEFKEKQIKNSKEKYGTNSFFQTDEFKEKCKDTNIIRYGKEYFSQTEKFISNMKLNTPEAQAKAKVTLLNNTGFTNPMQNPATVQKAQTTNIIKYGFKSPAQNSDIQSKMKNTTYERFGVYNYSKTQDFKDQHSQHALDNHIKFYESIGLNYNNNVFKCSTCNEEFNMKYKLVYWRNKHNHIICPHCNPLNKNFSQAEVDIYTYISSIYTGNVERNNTKVLNGLELDIYIPDKNIAIEYNGLYWHSDLFKDNTYHYNKTRKCEALGIKLIHIYENEWMNNQEGIKNTISHNLDLNKKFTLNGKISKEVSRDDIELFLLENSHTINNIDNSEIVAYIENSKIISMICHYDNTILSINSIGYIDYTKRLIDSLELDYFKIDNVYNISYNNYTLSHRVNPDIIYKHKEDYVVYDHGKTVYIKK